MQRSGSLRILLAALAVAASAADPAAADVRYEERVTGGVVVTWAGDRARGCAEVGLCDVTGSVVARSSGASSGESSGPGDEESVLGSLYLQPVEAVARVLRGPPDAPAGVCTDLVTTELEAELERGPGGSARVLLAPLGLPEPVPLAGRCAGPLASDLGDVLLSATVELRRLVDGFARMDLSGTQRFVSGPFSGEVRSTIVIERRSRRVPSASRRDGLRPILGRRRRMALLRMTYDVAPPAGTLLTDWAGAAEPFCHALDACGLSGSHVLRVGPGRGRGRLELFAMVPASRLPRGASAVEALRSGRVRPESISLSVDADATTVGTAARAGGPVCRDAVAAGMRFAAGVRRRALVIGLGPESRPDAEPDPLRTRCPGPGAADLPGRMLAGGAIPLRRLGARRLTVALRPRGAALPGAFTITRRGELTLRLRLRDADLDIATVQTP